MSFISPILVYVRLCQQVNKKWRKSGENKVEKILIYMFVAEAYVENDITPAENCTPYLIAAYNSHLEIKAGRVVSLIP